MTALLKRHRTLCSALFFLGFFLASPALAAWNFDSVRLSEVSWRNSGKETLVFSNALLLEPPHELVAADLPSDYFHPLIFWAEGTALAGGLAVGFGLCRKARKRTQKLSQIWEDCRDSRGELRRSNQELAALIEFAPLAVIVLDREGNIATWNPEAERMFGWSAPEVLGRPLSAVPDGCWTTYQEIAKRLQGGEIIRGREVEPRR